MTYLTNFRANLVFISVVLSILLSLIMVSATAEVANTTNTWRLNKEEKCIEFYLRNTKNSAVMSFKATMTVKSRLSSVLAVIGDVSSFPRWLYLCRSAVTLSSSDETRLINYIVLDMPWPLLDRDSLIVASPSQNKSTRRIEIKMHAEPKYVLKVSGRVRIETMYGRWSLTPVGSGEVNIIYEMTADPGGNIPKWLVNSMIADLPFYTLLNLREVIKEDKYANVNMPGIID